ncbi:mannose-binding lectin [Aspergillus heteromorphus CBS 117.55]|uniref:Mannose-binding lectin n=1 Tax=Aspergillus heteromorphus CBS 117.55 TaxID=1448321 RepID=A0A317WW42_9EURO|nr:mannose-binding lectin [Aspergillus heteromorphus CBS 117.55]PWY90101.1 mannose-binding lectin [Aspergillus heteromorphus CBS 117.55]
MPTTTTNPPHGGPGGSPFNTPHNKPIRAIRTWTGPKTDDHVSVIKGLEVFWDDDDTGIAHFVVGTRRGEQDTIEFDHGEVIIEMSIWAGSRVDSIHIRTESGHTFDAGGASGTCYAQEKLGNGILYGFLGRSGEDVDALGTYFHV